MPGPSRTPLRALERQLPASHSFPSVIDAIQSMVRDGFALDLSRSAARKLVMAGALTVDGRRVSDPRLKPRGGARLRVLVDEARLRDEVVFREVPLELTAAHVLYEDEWLIAIDKPAGIPTQATLDPRRDHLYGALGRFLKERDGGEPYVGLHHRLDLETSGVVLFTKKKEANAGVGEAFAKHLARKTYLAAVWSGIRSPRMEPTWTVKNHLGRAPGPGKRSRFKSVRSGGDFAHTDFRRIESWMGKNSGALVEAMPLTGRTHQIRVHLSESGFPIVGDDLYGDSRRDEGVSPPRMLLHAHRLELPHPITGAALRIESAIPAEFKAMLQNLRGGPVSARPGT
jgi:23S rRNA pseudouridine955/2504/2580 synthase